MENYKKAGVDKRKNKAKYRNKAKVVPKDKISHNVSEIETDDIGSGRIETNWYRYEGREEDESADVSRDFSLLSKAPIFQGNFEFKSDKIITEDTTILLKDNKYFDVDLNLLNVSIATISFQERCGIDMQYFSEDLIHEWSTAAESEKLKYEAFLKTEKYAKKNDVDVLPELKTKKKADESNSRCDILCVNDSSQDNNMQNKNLDVSVIGEEVDKMQIKNCDLTQDSPKSKNSTKDILQDDGEDLEQWLDDILDD